MPFSGQDYDEDELEKELEELEQEDLDEQLLHVPIDNGHKLPEVPTGDIKIPAAAVEKKDKREIDIHEEYKHKC